MIECGKRLMLLNAVHAIPGVDFWGVLVPHVLFLDAQNSGHMVDTALERYTWAICGKVSGAFLWGKGTNSSTWYTLAT